MSESSDYNPGQWRGFDAKQQRSTFDANAAANRTYGAKTSTGAAVESVPASVATECGHPLIVLCDVSGSMQKWPGVIFEKLPYLDNERKEYLGDDAEISFGAISDVNDSLPFQIRPFAKDIALKDRLAELTITVGGGGHQDQTEAHALAALYLCRNADVSKAIRKPTVIIITDEPPYSSVGRDEALAYTKVRISEGSLSTDAIFAELCKTFSVYVVLKPYSPSNLNGEKMEGVLKTAHARWSQLVGSDRIAILPSAERVVDVIFGILGRDTGKGDYFERELKERQRPEQVRTVMQALKTVHLLNPASGKAPDAVVPKRVRGNSEVLGGLTGKSAKRLLDD